MVLEIPPGPFAAFLFDCDGTLIDSMPLHFEAWNHGLREAGASWSLSEEYFYGSAGKSLEQVVAELNQRHGDSIDAARVGRSKERFFHERIGGLRAFPDVLGHLRAAHARGVPTAVVSGSAREAVERSLESTGVSRFVDTVVAAEDVDRGKPAPDGFLLAAERLAVEPAKCLVFEDGRAGLKAAGICGMATVAVDARRGIGRAAVQRA
jgi:HAD superfamily hydrolase (TIGR01509 family)